MSPHLSSVTVVVVAREQPVAVDAVNALSDRLASHFNDVEVVVLANGIPPERLKSISDIVDKVPDCTTVFLQEEVHDDVARLLGIDHAISDYILFSSAHPSELGALPRMLAALEQGSEVVIGRTTVGTKVERSATSAFLFWAFRKLYRLIAGRVYEEAPPTFRLLGRAAGLYVASRTDGEVLVRARSLGHGFAVSEIDVTDQPTTATRGVPLKKGASMALRLLFTGSTLPLRGASFLGMCGGAFSLLYAVYIVFVYFFKADVAPGWTTISMQLAGMMFLFSIQFVLLSEYLIQILHAAPAASRRHLVAREIRGRLSRRGKRLNIVDQEGRYQLGAPLNLVEHKSTT